MFESHLSRSDNIFRAALFLSVLFHLVVIMYLKLPELVEPTRAKVALSVILAKPQEAGQPTPEPPPPVVVPVTSLIPEMPALPPPELAIKHEQPSPPMDVPKPEPTPEPEVVSEEAVKEAPADPVKLSPEIVEAAKVQALLQIDENGEVQRIIWNTLPSLTNETLQRIEQHLRTRTYLATGKTYTLYEIVEIPRE